VLVLLERYQTQANGCKWVISVFEKLIRELESGRINYYDDSDFEIKPLTEARKRFDVQLSTLVIERIQDLEFVHENIKTLLHRMDASIENADPAGTLHASASIFETLAKDIVGILSVQNQTLGSFFSRYRKNSKLPSELLDYMENIYQQRNKTPLAGHGSLDVPNITIKQATVLAEMTRALVRVEYLLRDTPNT
jgi:hypothetical protein